MRARQQTLIQLWEEYRASSPADAYRYSQFTHYYRDYVKSIDVSMRQYYQPGEVCFVDFAGKRIAWTDEKTGETRWAEIFVGVLGYSQLVFAIALRSQKLEDWLLAHQKMFSYYGGVTQLVVPDKVVRLSLQSVVSFNLRRYRRTVLGEVSDSLAIRRLE